MKTELIDTTLSRYGEIHIPAIPLCPFSEAPTDWGDPKFAYLVTTRLHRWLRYADIIGKRRLRFTVH